ncbi:MAG: hypothetical protein GYB68_09025 [Chloroflexi bacterium]|nr:hypothetical protein [Chloroflexota bacterium]
MSIVNPAPRNHPCPICGGSDYTWGQATIIFLTTEGGGRSVLEFTTTVNTTETRRRGMFRSETVEVEREQDESQSLTARLCQNCGNVQVFSDPDKALYLS